MSTELFLVLDADAAPGGERAALSEMSDVVWVADPATAATIAADGVRSGVRLIELYGGFGLTGARQVIRAVDGRAPVGVAGHLAPPSGSSAVLIEDDTADPTTDRLVRRHPDGSRTSVIRVPRAAMAGIAAAEVGDGAVRVELCGGTALVTAADVVDRVGPDADIALVTWPFESIRGAAAYAASFASA
ncbi:DUF6506 family protein [Plantactinospora sp. GCM10030261]|uniref:DUF6506 family protein n=1 Tax=Plantactinospora sp. GCM10030261 TaxID=3273420 RepID=UPI00361B7684